jgi:hypothetical protein
MLAPSTKDDEASEKVDATPAALAAVDNPAAANASASMAAPRWFCFFMHRPF